MTICADSLEPPGGDVTQFHCGFITAEDLQKQVLKNKHVQYFFLVPRKFWNYLHIFWTTGVVLWSFADVLRTLIGHTGDTHR